MIRRHIMHKLTAFSLALCLSLAPYAVLAAKYDGSVPLLCAAIEVLECAAGAECHRGDAESVNLPPFVKIDVPQKVLSTTEAAAEQRKTPIRHVEQLDGQLTLQGGEGGRAWSLIIAQDTGKLTATITDDQVGFVIFGACTPF
jgi:hypothetical protein